LFTDVADAQTEGQMRFKYSFQQKVQVTLIYKNKMATYLLHSSSTTVDHQQIHVNGKHTLQGYNREVPVASRATLNIVCEQL